MIILTMLDFYVMFLISLNSQCRELLSILKYFICDLRKRFFQCEGFCVIAVRKANMLKFIDSVITFTFESKTMPPMTVPTTVVAVILMLLKISEIEATKRKRK